MKTMSKSLWARTLTVISLLLVMVLAITLTGCPNNQKDPEIPEGPETGLYYYDNNGTEFTLQLYSGNQFTLYNGVTKVGTYAVDENGVFSFTFAKEEDGTATATLANGVITFTYQNVEIRFLRKINYSVSFSTDGGTAIDPITVVNGGYANHPADPEKADHVFLGWYADAECKTPFVFASTPITSDTIVYAKWAYKTPGVPEYTISFEGADVADMLTIGGKLYDVPTPEKEGYTFGGWWISMSEDANKLTAQYEASYTFSADSTLFALWIAADSTTPVVEVTSSGVKWNNIAGATHYPVKITDPSGAVVYDDNVTGTSITYDFTTPGEYKIEVSAYVGGTTSAVTERYFTYKALQRVYQFTVIEPSILVFNKVPNAQEYIIKIVCGNPAHDHAAYNNGNSTVYNFANCDMVEGGISFTVTAKAYGFADSVSQTFTYERKLDTVTNITVENDIVTWAPVANATEYVIDVTVGDKTYTYTTNTFDYSLKYILNGEVTVAVKAVAKGYISPAAATYTYTKNTLATPDNISALGNTITWDAVEGENVSYAVYINGVKYPVNTNSLNLADVSLTATAGDALNIWVTSISGTVESAASDQITVNYREFKGALSYNKNTLYWPVVVGIDGEYEVRLNNDAAITVAGASTQLTFNKSGVNTVSVRFVGGGYTSAWISMDIDVYTITFDSRQGSGVAEIFFAPGDYVVLPTNTTRLGYTFANWYNTSGANGQLVTDGIFNNVGNVVLYAHWNSNTYKVTYNVGEDITDIVNGSTVDVLFGEKFELAVPSSDDGAFIGWSTGPNGSGIQLTDDQGKSIAKWNLPEDTNVYPMFATNVLEFVAREDGTWGVTSGPAIETVTNVIVPHTYQGKPVTAILENAFRYNSTMYSISIPNTVNVIGVGAFNTAYLLQDIHIREIEGTPNPIFSSYNGALIKNDLGTVYLEFVPRQKAGTFTVPEGVDSIRNKAFQNTNLIEKVVISKDVTKIAEQAFFNCSRLTEIEFVYGGDKPLTIDDNAFSNTPALATLKFPARLASVSIATLDTVEKLSKLYVEDGGEFFGAIDGVLTNGAKDTLLYAPTLWAGEVTIPVGVTSIGENAFANREGVTAVTIPAWFTSIGKNAFAGATNLTTVTIEGGKFEDLTIGEYAFAGCKSLTTLTVNGGSSMDDGALIIGAYAFANNAKLTTPAIAENANLTTIGAYAFSGCSSISEVVIQKTTTTIGERAYAQGTDISKVIFAENGANVEFGSFVFEGCQKLSSITIPSTITTFDGSVFAGCNNISAIIVDEDNPALSSYDGVLYDKNATTILYYPRAKAVDMTALPATVTKIGSATFQSNASITDLVIPARITEIGEKAFENCVNLTSVTFEGTADVVIGKSAFANCVKLATVTLPAGLTNIGERAFYLTAIATITIPERVTSIDAFAFASTNLTAITIPNSVATIAEGAFSNCAKLNTVTFAENGTSNLQLGTLEDTVGVFEGSAAITTVTLPKRVQLIGSRVFYNIQKITTMTIPADASLKTIGDWAFYYNKFNAINLPEGLTYIGSHAFDHCQGTSFKTLVIPTTVTEIGDNAFLYCNKLTTITFTEGGTASLKLNKEAFKYCSALTTITLPARLDEAYEVMTTAGGLQLTNFSTLFTSCSALKYIYVDDACEKYGDIGGIFCEKDATGNIARVIFCPVKNPGTGTTKTVTIPYTVTKVDNGAFNGVSAITKIVFEDTPNWNGTATLVLGDGYYGGYVSADDSYPVFKSTALTTIDLPVQLKSIGFGTFHTLSKLTSLTFDQNAAPLEIVGQRAMYKVTVLTSLALPKIASLSPYAISGNTKVASITLAPGSTLEEIPTSAFYENKALTAFVVPASVKRIGANAFTCSGTYSANKLASITFEEGSQLQYIGDKAFANIPLTSFTFPESVTTIGTNIFQSCGALTTLNLNSKMKNLYASDNTSIVAGLTKLTTIAVHPDNPYLQADEKGVLYSKDGKQLIYCPPALEITGIYQIPNTVTSIEANALTYFGKYGANTVLVLSNNLLKIGENALQNAYITSLSIPASVQEIGANAFASMTSLTTVTFADDSVLAYIGASAFSGCSKLAAIDLPDTVAELGTGVFTNCAALTSAELPAALTTLPANTFSGCKALKTVTLKEGLESIAGGAFNNCSALETIEFPASFRSTTGAGVFNNCTSLTTVIFPENTKVSTLTTGTFVNCPKLTTFTFPATVLVLNSGVISNCPNIETIVIEGAVTSIPDGMFKGFTGLTSITIPSSVTEIGANAFAGCTNLKNIIIPEGVTTIGANAFEDCTALETITLPTTLTTIGTAAFRDCTALKGVVIGKNVTTIGNYAFENCTAITSIEFASGNAIEMLGTAPDVESAIFRNTTALKSIVLPDSVKVIGAYLFENSGIEAIQLPKSLTAISEYAFAGCASLKSLTAPDAVLTVYDYAFLDCTSLASVEFGYGVERFGTAIFMNCTSLATVNIPSSISNMAGNPFINCPALSNIDFDANNTEYVYMNNMILDAELFTLVYYSPMITDATPKLPSTVRIFAAGAFYGSQIQSFEVPATLTEISDIMFMDSKNLTTITLPNNITRIGLRAFMGCSALTKIEIPQTVTEIDEYAFANCTSLAEVTFAERKTPYTIGAHAFDGAANLAAINLPEGITGLAPYMFANSGLVSFTLPASVTNLNVEGVFYGSKLTTFDVANANVNVGNTLGVKFFMNSASLTTVKLPNSITRLGELVFDNQSGDTNYNGVIDPIEASKFRTDSPSYAFAGCASLTSIDLSNIYWIGTHAFDGCASLTTVTFGKYLSVVGDYAFANCTALTTLDFSSNLKSTWLNSSTQQAEQGLAYDQFQYFARCSTEIGQYAFQNCSALTTVTFAKSYSGLYWGTLGTGMFEGCTSLTQAGFTNVPSSPWKSSTHYKNLPAA